MLAVLVVAEEVVEEVPLSLSSLLLLLVVEVLVSAARLEVLVDTARVVELRGMTPPEPGARGIFVGRIWWIGGSS